MGGYIHREISMYVLWYVEYYIRNYIHENPCEGREGLAPAGNRVSLLVFSV
jgi:hypothetical protein